MLKSVKCLKLSSRIYINKKHFSSNIPKICVIGSGPAGFYAAQYILKHSKASVDIIERLPVPFGLVRYGVAPDHPEVKNVINTFTKTAENPKFRFIGNIALGKDVFIKDLRECYDAVLLTYGADNDAFLNISNEDKTNVISAREFVAWYNGLPGFENLNPDLSGSTAMLLGQGNVAIDVARIVLSPIDQLAKTDITSYALDALSKSNVNKVYLIGRRGPLQVAFTIKELREILKLPGVDTVWRQDDFKGVSDEINKLTRPRKRLIELMLKSVEDNKTGSTNKQFCPIFNRSPINVSGSSKVESVEFTVNNLIDGQAIATQRLETIKADLICRSIGYKSTCADEELNFDKTKGLVKNLFGRVLQKHSRADVEPGIYASGWVATGPTGVILTTMNNAFSVADTICKDLDSGALKCYSGKRGLDIKNYRVVSWQGWEKINTFEIEQGKKINKPREKIVNIEQMLKIAGI